MAGDGVKHLVPILPLLTLGGLAIWINYNRRKSKALLSTRKSRATADGFIKNSVATTSIQFSQDEKETHSIEVDDIKEDYLSQLPDDVLSSILANLSLTDAVRTSILSKRWKYLYASMPALKFRCLNVSETFNAKRYKCPYEQPKFGEGVNQLLQLYSSRRVALIDMCFCFWREHSSINFNHWLLSLSRLGVEYLFLCFSCHAMPFSNLFTFSLELLSQISSLKVLSLSRCIVQLSPKVRFNSLTTLTFSCVSFAIGQLEGVLSACSKLKMLAIQRCELPYKLRLSSTVTTVYFWACDGMEEIDLRAANLHRLELNHCGKIRFSFSFVPLLEYVMVTCFGPAEVPNIFGEFARDLPAQVKSLTIQLITFPTGLNMFRNIKQLSLILSDYEGCVTIAEISPILGACPLLQRLELTAKRVFGRKRGRRWWPLSPSRYSKLKEVRFGGFQGTRSEIEIVLYILRSAVVLEQIFLSPEYSYYAGNRKWWKFPGCPLDEIKRNSIQQKLHGQAISEKAVVIIQ